MLFVLFHGSYGNTKENWLPYLKEELEVLKQDVVLEQYPVENYHDVVVKGKGYKSPIQNIETWTKKFLEIYKAKIKSHKNIVFIGHSLAPVFMLEMVEKFGIPLQAAIFVSPFFILTNLWEFDGVNGSFYRENFDFKKLRALIAKSYVIYGDTDPYVPVEQPRKFAEQMGSEVIVVKDGGHLNASAGFSQFPLLLEICKKLL